MIDRVSGREISILEPLADRCFAALRGKQGVAGIESMFSTTGTISRNFEVRV
jgi:hypothetical protein